MPPPHLSVTVEPSPEGTRLIVVGELDLSTRDRLKDAASQALDRGPNMSVAIDMAQLSFCDSSGLAALISLRKAADTAGVTMVLLNLPDHLERVLKITSLRDYLVGSPAVAGHRRPSTQAG